MNVFTALLWHQQDKRIENILPNCQGPLYESIQFRARSPILSGVQKCVCQFMFLLVSHFCENVISCLSTFKILYILEHIPPNKCNFLCSFANCTFCRQLCLVQMHLLCTVVMNMYIVYSKREQNDGYAYMNTNNFIQTFALIYFLLLLVTVLHILGNWKH